MQSTKPIGNGQWESTDVYCLKAITPYLTYMNFLFYLHIASIFARFSVFNHVYSNSKSGCDGIDWRGVKVLEIVSICG